MKIKKMGYTVCAFMLATQLVCSTDVLAAPKMDKNNLKLHIGQTHKVKILGTNAKIKWSSSNKKIATVNNSGVITTKNTGKATIMANLGMKQLTCKVSVDNPSLENLEKYLKSKKLLVGKRTDMTQGCYLIGAKKGFKYSVGDERIEVYEYDINSPEYKELKRTGMMNIFDTELKVNAINGKFVLYCEVDNVDKIVKIFKRF